ncbi:hypothetical protein [Curtobacterium sp. 1310]|uniref:hypothetical protein n=1 Tax=Curtobacterium sp. 1310 TaxID=2806570 RepID=UPI001AEA69FA|nr:hypothetical protein [Curtobacterium sp. 1310]MBP1303064.1 hypothetical protein [Curtobacterium sp. 1310]
MSGDRLRTSLLCIAALLSGAGTTLALVGAFVIPADQPTATWLTVTALPLVLLGVAALLAAVLLGRRPR